MKIAFVTARPPYPPNSGGRIRAFHLLREVSGVHDVTLITACEKRSEEQALATLETIIPRLAIRAVTVEPETPLGRLGRAIGNPMDSRPYTWARYGHVRFTAHVRDVLRDLRYDIIHCEHVQVAYALDGLATPPRVITAQNVESQLIRRIAARARPWWKRRVIGWQASKVLEAERRVFRLFDRCLAVSESDAAEIERMVPGAAVSVVRNGVDLSQFTPSVARRTADLMVFTGAMDWLPNVDGVRFFVREILPRIRQGHPDARLLVVGSNPSDALVRELGGASVHFTGTVEDVRPYLDEAHLVVVPLRAGGGTRLKILEAWAVGKPVVSTTIGAEGLPTQDGQNIALADSPEAFARRASHLLSDAGAAEQLGAAGRRVVEEHFGWDRIARALLQAYEVTLAGDRNPRFSAPPVRSDGEDGRSRELGRPRQER